MVQLWPECPPPPYLSSCIRCELSAQTKRKVWGEGTENAPIMIILDNPGSREDKEGVPFICGTRQTLQSAMEAAGISEKDIFLTFLLKCRPRRKYDHEEARRACLPFLESQILDGNPQIILALGNVVTGTLFGADKDVKSTRGQLLNYRGIPALTSYHPLAARRRPHLMNVIIADFKKAWKYLSITV